MDNEALIIAYWQGELSLEEQQAFEKRLAEDTEFKEEVAELKALLDEALSDYYDGKSDEQLHKVDSLDDKTFPQKMEQRDKMEAFIAALGVADVQLTVGKEQEIAIRQILQKADTKPIRRLSNRSIAIAASILIIVGLFSLILSLRTVHSNEKLVAKHFQAENIFALKGPSSAVTTFEQYYQQGNYAAAIDAAQTVSEIDSHYTSIVFFTGNAHLKLGNVDAAIRSFENAFAKPTSAVPSYKTQWYLAFAYLQNDDVQQAERLFLDIQTNAPDVTYRNAAMRTLADINSFWRRVPGVK